MADGKEVAVVETSTANPKQAVNVIDNIENVSAFNTPTQTLQENPAIFKQQENNSFFNSDAWNTFKSNPMRAFEPKYPGFAAIESVASNPVYTSTVDRYGEAVANRAQVLHSTYAKATNPFSRFAEAYNTHRYGLRAAAARKELSDAIRDGDEAKVSTAKLKYQSERRKSYEEGYGYEEYGDTLMSVLASMARNPETIAIEIGGAAAAPFTGGASMLAANAINAGIVGADTYKIEAGGALELLDENSPELSEEQKMAYARNVGWLNAAVEAGMFGMGGNVLGRGVKAIGTEAAIKSTVRAVRKETGKEITRDAAKELLKVRFVKALQNPAKEKTFKDTLKEVTKNVGLGALGEGGQEVFQNSVTESMLRSVKNGTTLTEEMLDDWTDFVTNPFGEAHADKWETFVNVSLASLVPGLGFQGVAGAIRGYKGTRGQAELNDVQSKLLGARNNSLGLSQLFSWHKNAGSKDAIGVSNAVLEDQIKRGEVSGKLYTTAEQVAEMQKDPEVAAALEEIGIAKALEQAAENGGVVELDLVAYDKVVNESQNTALFQKMRNYLSFSDTTMSLNEFNQFINSKGKQLASLITDEIRNDQESVYNKLKAMALKAGRPEERAEGYAVLGHLILTNMEGLVNGQKNDILDRLTLKVSTDNETLVEKFNKEKTEDGTRPTTNSKEAYREQDKKDVARIMVGAKPVTVDQIKQDFQTVVAQSDKAREQLYATGDDSGFAKNTQHIYVAQSGDQTWYWRATPTGRFERINKYSNNNSHAMAGSGYSDDVNRLDEIVSKIPDIKFFEVSVDEFEKLSNEFLTRDHPGMADVDIAGMVDAVFTEAPAAMKEAFSIADENAKLDAENKPYEGDTINIDGVERPTKNSEGKPIAKSEPALRNFWKWFGDSKVVDKDGRPLVVYHGSDVSGIEVFDSKANKTKQRQIGADKGIFFTDSKKVAERFRTPEQRKAEGKYYTENTVREPVEEEKYDAQGRYLGSVHYVKTTLPKYKNFGLYPVYLKAESVNEYNGEDIGVGVERETALESARQSGKDGVIIYKADTGAGIANEYIVFDSTQIKSTENSGEWSKKNKNVYHMVVYAGSRVDYDKPSLEAIGTGEGVQAHGWGLYYALDKDIAERYREMFTGDAALKYDEEKLLKLYEKYERAGEYDKAELIGSVLLRHDERDFDSMLADEIITQDTIKWFDSIKDNYLNKERKLGQVHEVDIPEVDYLLDEQKPFNQQSQFIQTRLKDISEKLASNPDFSDTNRFKDGGEIYSYLSTILNGDKYASQYLDENGVYGITYDGRDDGRCFVIFNDASVQVLRKKFDALGRQLFMFAGEKANTSALPQEFQDRIQKAKDMIAKGKSDKQVFEKTRLHIAPDGRLRIQISDRDAQLTEDSDKILRWGADGKLKNNYIVCNLEEIFEHKVLFELYPGLRKLPVHFVGKSTYHSGLGYINLGSTNTKARIRQSILHEVQHAIQDMERWAQGGEYTDYTGNNKDYWDRQRIIHQKIFPKLVKNKVITYWSASDGGDTNSMMYERMSSADEMRALIDSPAVKKIAAKDTEFAEAIEKVRQLNKELERFDSRLSFTRYFRLFGEAESRLTERLSYKSQEELDKLDPYGYFDTTRFLVKVGGYGARITADVEAPKNTQDTGEFNVVFDAETGRSIVDGKLIVAGKTTELFGHYTIELEPEANAVTFAHELFHVLSLEIQRVYNEGTITEYWKKQAEKMFKIAGAEAQVDETDPTVERYYLTEAQEEHLANMFTTYIMKGKIQNREVRGLLAKLIDIFKATYQQLEGAGLTPMALDKKANEFFNAVISSQSTIEEIQRDAGLLEILPPEGVDRELYDYYIDNLTTSKVEASNDLRRKWFAIDGFKKSAEYTKLMQRLKEEAKAELLEDDRYKIIAQASLFEGKDKAEQVFIWAQNNMPEANYTLGDITDILENTPSLEEASTKAAEQEMEAYIVKKFRITPQDLGFKEERNRAKVRALLAESVMRRGGALADMESEIKKAEAASDKHIANISVYQIIDLNKWKNREAAIVERYAWARQQDNKDLMSAERYNQAVVNLIMIKANGYKSEYQKLNALFEKLQTKQKKYQRKDEHGKPYGPYEHRYHAEDWELLRSISEKFGNNIRDGRRSVKNVHEQLVDWIKTQVENRFTTVAGLEDFLPFINKGHDGKIGSMKGKNFKKLWAVMHTIDSVAMREQQLYLDGQYQQLGEFVDETVKFHKEKQIKTDEDKESWYHKYFGRYGTWQNPEPLLKAIFPPKVFQKIFLPMFEGALKSEYIAKRWIKEWNDAKAKINTSNEAFVLDDGSQITYGETVKKTMTYGDVANLLIAMGAEHSYENYRLKFGLSEEQVQMIASQAIKRNAAYVDFMNTTWKVYGKATEALNDSFQERTNELFVRKEHRAFEVDGIKFEGGYVPEDKHYVALVRELGTWNQGLKNKKENKNEKLLTKAADGDILSIIDITETKLSQSAKWAYAAVPYNNVKKFIEQKAVSDTIGDRAFNFIKDWLQGWDTPHFDESGIWRPLTRVTTVAALGARASTVLLQLSGIMQAFTHLGPTYLARGMLQFIRENGFFHPFKAPKDKSIYMETRVEDPFSARFGTESQGRSFKDILNSYNAKSKVGKAALGVVSAYQTAAMVSIQIVDGWVSTITWNGAYARALDKGMTEAEARAEADSAVRITQSDATQISRSAAMQEPWARAVTAFSTWIMAMRSQVVALSTSKSYRKDMAMWMASYAVASSFIEAFLKEVTEPADKGEEDKEMLERIFDSWYNKIVEAVGSQAMPFAGFGSSAAKIAAAALVNTDDEKIFNVYAGGNVAALQYGWRVAQAGGQALKYMRTGEDEDLEKLGVQATGLVSYGLKKRVKKALED